MVLFMVLAVLLLAGGVALVIGGVMVGGTEAIGVYIAGAALIVTGVVFIFVGRYLGGHKRRQKLGRGMTASGKPALAGQATVLDVRDTGVTVNNTSASFEFTLQVSVSGMAPYEATIKELVGRTQYGAIQPGMTVGVFVDPDDPSNVALDRRPVV